MAAFPRSCLVSLSDNTHECGWLCPWHCLSDQSIKATVKQTKPVWSVCCFHVKVLYNTHIHNHFNGSFVRDYLGKPIPKETITHSHPSWSSDILYQLPPFTTIHSILFVQFTCLTVPKVLHKYGTIVVHIPGNDVGCIVLLQRVTLWLPSTDMVVLHMSTTQQCRSSRVHQDTVSRSGTTCSQVRSAAWRCTWGLTARCSRGCGRDAPVTVAVASPGAGCREKSSSAPTTSHSTRCQNVSVVHSPKYHNSFVVLLSTGYNFFVLFLPEFCFSVLWHCRLGIKKSIQSVIIEWRGVGVVCFII